jgi:hypothetical protein
MARLYTKLVGGADTRNPSTGTELLSFNYGIRVPDTGQIWVIRDVSGVAKSAPPVSVEFKLTYGGETRFPTVSFFRWTVGTTTVLPAGQSFHWQGRLVMRPGTALATEVAAGQVQFWVSGWVLYVPEATTPVPT